MNAPFYISGRERTNPPSKVSSDRYSFLALKDAEPNLGIPFSNARPASATWVLTTDANGNRYFATTVVADSVYTSYNLVSTNLVSTYLTVNALSTNWSSAYTTLNENSGTWLTVPSANSLYFKISGGDIFGNTRIRGDLLVIGSLSAISGIEIFQTRFTQTTSLSIINVGQGPALYVKQAGFYDNAEFHDSEGGIILFLGNIIPPNPFNPTPYTGLVGIRTSVPNKTLTVVGDISSSNGFYTDGVYVSAGQLLDKIIFETIPPSLRSVVSTVSSNSASWSSVYSSWFNTSANYATFFDLSSREINLSAINVFGDTKIYGTLFSFGSSFFTNTNITVTSALSVVNTGPGPALFVSQGRGPGNIATFYDTDYGSSVLYIGNAADASGIQVPGVIGIKTNNPNKTLTVVGEISSTSFINEAFLHYNAGNISVGRNIQSQILGIDNVIVGDSAGQNLAFGSNNVFIGKSSGNINSDGDFNVFVGSRAGVANTVGIRNIFIGYNAGSTNSSTNNNISIGYQAGLNNIGTNNVFIGDSAGQGSTNASSNIIIGSNANITGALNNVLVIGPGASVTGNNQLVIGSAGTRYTTGTIWTNFLAINNVLSAQQTSVFNLTGDTSRFNNSNILTRLVSNNITELSGVIGLSGTNYLNGVNILSGSNFIRNTLTVSGSSNISGPISINSTVSGSIRGSLTTEVSGTTVLYNSGGIIFEANQQYIRIPAGNTGLRPSNPVDGYIRYNTTLSAVEMWYEDAWRVPYVTQHIDVTSTSDVPVPVNSTLWVDTTTRSITATLPTSPGRGDTVRVFDLARTFNTFNFVLSARTGQTIQGDPGVLTVTTRGAAFDLVFYNNTRGWRIISV